MALRLPITDKRGVTANYHRIISATQAYDKDAGIHINLAGYISKEFRDLEALPTEDPNYQETTVVTVTTVYLPFVAAETFKIGALYTRLKNEIAELKTATDE